MYEHIFQHYVTFLQNGASCAMTHHDSPGWWVMTHHIKRLAGLIIYPFFTTMLTLQKIPRLNYCTVVYGIYTSCNHLITAFDLN